jgi:hypothetical protein
MEQRVRELDPSNLPLEADNGDEDEMPSSVATPNVPVGGGQPSMGGSGNG